MEGEREGGADLHGHLQVGVSVCDLSDDPILTLAQELALYQVLLLHDNSLADLLRHLALVHNSASNEKRGKRGRGGEPSDQENKCWDQLKEKKKKKKGTARDGNTQRQQHEEMERQRERERERERQRDGERERARTCQNFMEQKETKQNEIKKTNI